MKALGIPLLTYLFLLIYGYREGHLSREDIVNYLVWLIAPTAVMVALRTPMVFFFAVIWLIFLVLLLMFKCELPLKMYRPP